MVSFEGNISPPPPPASPPSPHPPHTSSVHISVFKPINVWSLLFFLQNASSSGKHKRMPCTLEEQSCPWRCGLQGPPGWASWTLEQANSEYTTASTTTTTTAAHPSNVFLSGPQSSDSTCSSVALFLNPGCPISIDNWNLSYFLFNSPWGNSTLKCSLSCHFYFTVERAGMSQETRLLSPSRFFKNDVGSSDGLPPPTSRLWC